ncbi:hypothetical protein [Fructilactobacillus carniphilus]|uniref:Uncharacterized protein n=1 Tax=Fructilactobacillus carniphilus TaxID=2940297 RepID=A0ABY5BUW8_9LACO|nr:hypothetical protein [Fructilactobacillus carniphilus]USS90292.1 hypothetical protein M3M37_05465 [Fructilactobacillus carniphilus]
MTKSIFSATFEESKNLLNDSFYKKDKADQANNEKRFKYNRKKIVTFEILGGIFATLFLLILPGWGASYLCTRLALEKGIPNFSPFFIFKGGLLLLLIFGIISLIVPKYWKIFWGKFDYSFIGIVWLLIEANGVICLIGYVFHEFYLLLLTYFVLLIILIMFIIHRIHLTKILLYKVKENQLDITFKRTINLLYAIIPSLVSIYFVIKIINPNVVKTNFTFTVLITGSLLFSFCLNLFGIFLEVYQVSTYLLVGYYYHKYSEDYRKLENKTYQQWYGKFYMKLKGLKDDETKQ